MVEQNIFEHIEHAKHIYNMMGISNLKKSKIKFVLHRFASATLFFLDDILKNIKKEDIPPIEIIFDLIDKQSSRGSFDVIENSFIIHLSTKNIVKQFNDGFIQSNILDSLFYVLLHEIGHLVRFLKLFINNKQETSLEALHIKELDKKNEEIHQIYNHYKFDSSDLAFLNQKEEIEADRFAYKNLCYYRTLYENKGYNYCSTYMCREEEESID